MLRSRLLYRPAWSPLEFGDALVLFLNSSNQGTFSFATGISQWRDRGPRGNHVAQATGASQPTLQAGALNGRPGVRCASQFLLGACALSGADTTVLVVARLQSGAQSGARGLSFADTGVVEAGAGGYSPLRRPSTTEAVSTLYAAAQQTSVAVTYNSAFMFTTVTNGAGASSRVNGGTENTSATVPSLSCTRVAVGTSLTTTTGSLTTLWSDDIYAVVVLNVALPTIELQRLQGWASHEWLPGVLPATHPFAKVRP